MMIVVFAESVGEDSDRTDGLFPQKRRRQVPMRAAKAGSGRGRAGEWAADDGMRQYAGQRDDGRWGGEDGCDRRELVD